jgi:hypothetical protein
VWTGADAVTAALLGVLVGVLLGVLVIMGAVMGVRAWLRSRISSIFQSKDDPETTRATQALSAVGRTAISCLHSTNQYQPKPTTGWTGAAGGVPAGRGLGRSPILKNVPLPY